MMPLSFTQANAAAEAAAEAKAAAAEAKVSSPNLFRPMPGVKHKEKSHSTIPFDTIFFHPDDGCS